LIELEDDKALKINPVDLISSISDLTDFKIKDYKIKHKHAEALLKGDWLSDSVCY
jgi:hypothetical protein